MVSASKLKKATGPWRREKVEREKRDVSKHVEETIERAVNGETTRERTGGSVTANQQPQEEQENITESRTRLAHIEKDGLPTQRYRRNARHKRDRESKRRSTEARHYGSRHRQNRLEPRTSGNGLRRVSRGRDE